MTRCAALLTSILLVVQDSDEALKKANETLARGEYDAAIEQYTQIYEQNPKALGALVNRSAAKLRKGDLDGAIEDATLAIKGGSNLAEVFNNRGSAHKLKGEFAAAIADHSMAIVLQPKRISSYLDRADAKGESGDLKGAVEDCSLALEVDASNSAAFAKRAQWKRPGKDWDGAKADATKAIKLDPKNAAGYFYRGTVHMAGNDLVAARKDFDKALDCDPTVAAFWNSRGVLKNNREDFDGALADFDRAVQLAPQNPEYLYDRAAALMSRNELPRAVADCEKALKVAPKGWALRPDAEKRLQACRLTAAFNACLKAEALAKTGEFDQAIEAYQEALRFDSSSPEVRGEVVRGYTVRAKARLDKNNYAGAVQDYTNAIRLDPACVPAYFGRGFANFEKYSFSDAIPDFKKVLELDPKNFGANYYLGASHGFQKKQAAAVEWYTRALDLSPENVPALIMRASMKVELGQYDSAIEDCNHALKNEPTQYGAVFHRAACYLGKEDWKLAGADYERVLKESPLDWDWRERAAAILPLLPELSAEKADVSVAKRLIARAKLLIAKKDYGPAIAILEEVLRLDSKSKEGYEAIALAHYRRDDDSKGDHRAAITRALDLVELGKGVSPEIQIIINTRSSLVLTGLLWLARHQSLDGRWSASGFGETCVKDGSVRCEGKGREGSDVRATGFVILAFFGAGYSQLSKDNYGTKPIGETLTAGLKWLIGRQNPDGSFGDKDSEKFIEDHAIATLAMSEAYGMTASSALKEPAEKAMKFLRSANLSGKGWPRAKAADGADPEATGWALLALWSGKMGEIPGAEAALEEGFEAFRRTAMSAQGNQGEVFALAAAACRRKPLPENELGNRLDKLSNAPPSAAPESVDPIRLFISTVALRYGDGGDRWRQWKDKAKDVVIKTVRRNDTNLCPAGSWNLLGPIDTREGRLIVTALNVMTLEIYYGYVNAFGHLASEDGK
jgi:tetratricopeptide (TPR) repeat protein